jgi:tetratricopeptide (TPR) repeat protein
MRMVKMKILTTINLGLFFIIILFSSVPAYADTIYLKNGMRMDVERAWREKRQIKYEMFGSVYSYSVDEVVRIEKGGEEKADEEDAIAADHDASFSSGNKKDLMDNYSKEFVQLYQNKKWDEAISVGKEMYRLAPQNKAVCDMLSHFYLDYAAYLRKSGKPKEEIKALKKSLSYTPKHKTVLKKLTAALVLSASRELSNRNYDAAKMLSMDAAGFDNENPDPYVLLGKIAYNTDDYNGARLNWRKALKRKPDYAGVQSMLRSLEKDRKVEDNLRVYESGNFILKFEGKRKQLVMDRTIKILNKAYQDVGSELSVYPDEKIYVLVYPKSDLEKLDYLPDWSAGRYDGKIRISEDMCTGSDYFEAILYHEYTHSIVHMLGGRNVPLWLNEGMAEYMSRKLKPSKYVHSREKLLLSAAEKNSLIPIDALTKINGYGLSRLPVPMIQLMYAQSEAFVTYLVKRYSIYDIKRVIKETGKGVSPESSIRRRLHSDVKTLDQDWRKQLASSGY